MSVLPTCTCDVNETCQRHGAVHDEKKYPDCCTSKFPVPAFEGEPKLPANCERAQDPVVERNRQMLLERSNVGIQKYGKGLGNPLYLTSKQALQHALEEALDLANYLQAEIMKIEAEEQEAAKKVARVACTHLSQRWNLFMTFGHCTNCGVTLRAPVNAIRPVEDAGSPQEASNGTGCT